MIGANAVPRCCGDRRQEGGVYIECGGGTAPLEDFLLCPPILIQESFGLQSNGEIVS